MFHNTLTISNVPKVRPYDYLLFKQLKRLEKDFLENGGFTERLYALRPPPPTPRPKIRE